MKVRLLDMKATLMRRFPAFGALDEKAQDRMLEQAHQRALQGSHGGLYKLLIPLSLLLGFLLVFAPIILLSFWLPALFAPPWSLLAVLLACTLILCLHHRLRAGLLSRELGRLLDGL